MFLVIEKQKCCCASPRRRCARHHGWPAADVFHSTEVTAFLSFETPRNLEYCLSHESKCAYACLFIVHLSQNLYQFACLPPNVSLCLGQRHVLVTVEHARVWQSDTLVGWACWRGNFCWTCGAARPHSLQQQQPCPTAHGTKLALTLQKQCGLSPKHMGYRRRNYEADRGRCRGDVHGYCLHQH